MYLLTLTRGLFPLCSHRLHFVPLTVSDEDNSANEDEDKPANEDEGVYEQTDIVPESHAEEVTAQGVCVYACLSVCGDQMYDSVLFWLSHAHNVCVCAVSI